MSVNGPPLSLLTHPYTRLVPVTGGRAQLSEQGRRPGSALVWTVPTEKPHHAASELVEARPGGLSLLVLLPPAPKLSVDPEVIQTVQRARPHGILPHHRRPSPADLAQVLRRPPDDLPADLTDYIAWRGIPVERETMHLIRRIVDLSANLRSITALARSMYISRRALGRRFLNSGLPVPSHWLQLARLLRVAIKLQNSDTTVFSVAYEFGYPDGFSVSNQMHRLLGYRPSDVRMHLGWEWIVEAWLRREAELGALAPANAAKVEPAEARPQPATTEPEPQLRPRASRERRRTAS